MTRYADPNTCPNCGSPARGEPRCAQCGLLLLGPTPELLLSKLADADRILDGLRAEALGWRQATAYASAAQPSATDLRHAPRTAQPAEAKDRSWSTGSVLLALGALCLMAAAFVFVSVAWGSLGLLGRTAVLGVVTLTVASAAAAVTARRLRASAEALWAVALAMLAIDYAGARAYGLAGLDSVSVELSTVLLGVLVGGSASGIAVFADRVGTTRIAVAEVAASIGLTLCVVGGASASTLGETWTALLIIAPVLAIAAGFRALQLSYASAYAIGVAGLSYAAAVVSAVGDALVHDTVRGVIAHTLDSTLAASAATVALGVAAYRCARRRGDGELADVLAGATSAIASAQLLVLVYAPALDDVEALQLVAGAVPAVLTVAGVVARGRWLRGVRVTALLAMTPVAYLAITWGATAAAAVARSMTPIWSDDVWATAQPMGNGLGPVWLAVVVFGSLAVSAGAIAHYADIDAATRGREPLLAAAVGMAAAGALTAAVLMETPLVLIAGAVVGLGTVAAGLFGRVAFQAAGLAIVVAAAPIALVSQVASLCTWSLVAVSAAGIAFRVGVTVVRPAAVAVSVGFGQVVATTGADLAGAEPRILQLTLVAVVAATLIGAQYVSATDVRVAAEAVAGAAGMAALLAGLGLSLGWQSAMLTVLGAVLAGISLLRPDRRMLSVAAAVLLGLAYVLRLVASDVGVVEAYTLPFGIVLLVAGYVRMSRVPTARSSTALLPGLSLALLPSLPYVLADPTTVRGLALGLAACAVLAAGAWLRLQVPFVVGATLVALIVTRHLGPYADAVPRWALIAAAGTILLVVGVTWESRVRDARAVASYVGALR